MKAIAHLREMKGIQPAPSAIDAQHDAVIQNLAEALQALSDKYAVTYNEIETGIAESEKKLAELIGQLSGDEFAINGLSNLIKK